MEKNKTVATKSGKKTIGTAEKAGSAAAKKKQEKKQALPVYLIILLVVFGIVLGLAINQLFLAKPQQLPGGSANQGNFKETEIELKVIYNSDCKICSQQSSIEALLQQRKIKYSAERLDMKIIENGVLAGTFGMKTFPSSLLNWKQLKITDPDLYQTLKTLFPIQGDYFVIPELELMKQTEIISPVMFMEAPTAERCGIEKGTAKLTVFSEFQSEQAANAQKTIDALQAEFNNALKIDYRNFLVKGSASEAPAIAVECARDQNLFLEFRKALLEAKFVQQRNISDYNELKKIGTEQKIPDQNKFELCLDTKQTMPRIEKDLLDANAYGFFGTPSIVIDCIFTVTGAENLKAYICAFHPEFNACN